PRRAARRRRHALFDGADRDGSVWCSARRGHVRARAHRDASIAPSETARWNLSCDVHGRTNGHPCAGGAHCKQTRARCAVPRVPLHAFVRIAYDVTPLSPPRTGIGDFDALHFTDWLQPPQRAGVRATMIHDLGPLHFPEHLHRRTVGMHTANAQAAKRCDVVFTNSEYTANDITATLGIPRERLRV